MRCVARTQRLSIVGGDRTAALGERPAIFVHWHAQILIATAFTLRHLLDRGRPVAVIASLSRDGELGARVAARLGLRVERGSSSRGGDAALRRLHRQITQHGASVVLAVDGPRGPERQSKPGAIVLAQVSEVPVVPLGLAASSAFRVGSWDRTLVPWPFSRTRAAIGAPIWVPKQSSENDRATLSRELDSALDALTRNAAAGVP